MNRKPPIPTSNPPQRARLRVALLIATALPAPALDISFPITEDTYVDSRAADQHRNFGLSSTVRVLVNSDGSVTRGLFALPAPVHAYPPGLLLEAQVYFYVFQDNTKTRDIRLHPLSRPFIEGTGGSGAAATGATWFTADGTNDWSTPGGDYDTNHAVVGVKEPVLDPQLNDRFFRWDITALLTNGATRADLLNHGAILIIDESPLPPSSSDRAPFTSSESTSNPPEYRPRLTLKLQPRQPRLNLRRSGPEEFQLEMTNALPFLPHRIERTFDLTPPVVWTEVATLTPTGTATNWTDTVHAHPTNVFYRVVIAP